jgi:nicotinamide mononucleotide transporter
MDFFLSPLFLEMLATVFGVISVYLLTVGDGRGWALGCVWIVLTGYIFWVSNILGSALLQVFFLVTQCVGWWRWKTDHQSDLRLTSGWLSGRSRFAVLVCFVLSWGLLDWWLARFGGTSVGMDSFVTVGSVFAQTMMVLGRRECWLIWLAVNAVYVVLSFLQGLWAFALLYLLFCGLAVNGWREWTRDRGE